MANIISGPTFNVDADINFAAVKVTANGRKTIGVNNKKSKSSKITYISTPLMLTWGINKFVDEATGNESFDMALQFPQAEYMTPEAQAFLKNMQQFEETVKKTALENSKDCSASPLRAWRLLMLSGRLCCVIPRTRRLVSPIILARLL